MKNTELFRTYDVFGDTLILSEDKNPNIIEIQIIEDMDESQLSFTLGKTEALQLANKIIGKFSEL